MSTASETLNAMVLQPNTSNASLSDTGKYSETWKGPWDEIKKVTKNGIVYSATFRVGNARPTLNGTYWKSEYNPPDTLGTDWPWVIQNISIEQLQSGEHGLLKIDYETGVVPGEDPSSSEKEGKEDRSKRKWTLQWGSYRFPVLNFMSDSSLKQAIVQYKNHPITNANYWYYSDTTRTDVAQLPEDPQVATQAGSRQVANFFINGVAPLYHYPIITYHQEYIVAKDEELYLDIGKDIDKILTESQLPNDCIWKSHITPPYGRSSWQWMMTSDTGTYSEEKIEKSVQFELDDTKEYYRYFRDTRWEGSIKYEPKFYGDSTQRWTIPN